jgi:sugar porter (SP) family MFS transporter
MYNKKIIYFISFGAALAGLLFGIDMGVMSGALPFIQKSFKLTVFWMEIVTSTMLIGAAFGGLISRWISYRIGRRNSIIWSGAIFVITFLGSAVAPDAIWLAIIRFVLGVGLEIASFNTPLYLAEISPKEIRGKLTGSYQLMIAIGTIVAFLSDTLFGSLVANNFLSPEAGWRIMLAVVAIPAFIMILIVAKIPKSPRWLVLRGKDDEAVKVLKYIGSKKSKEEVASIKESLIFNKINWRLLLNKNFLYLIWLGFGLQLIQQFCCKNTLNYYAPKLFYDMGFHTFQQQMWLTTISVGVVGIIFTYISMQLVDKYGRKPLLYISGFLILLGCLMISVAFAPSLHFAYSPFIGFLAIIVFMMGYGIGYGPVIWVVCAEIFPLQGRELGMCAVVLTNWIGNFVVGMVTLSLLQNLGVQKFFILIMIIQVISLIFLKLFLPETKNKSLEEIEKEFFGKEANAVSK